MKGFVIPALIGLAIGIAVVGVWVLVVERALCWMGTAFLCVGCCG